MEALYIKLYQKYSKLKDKKENELDKISQEQEEKFYDYVTVAEDMINALIAEKKILSENVDELQKEVVSLRTEKIQQAKELMEERQKTDLQLSVEVEQLRNLQQERMSPSSRNGRSEEPHINSNQRSPSVSRGQTSEPSAKRTGKRARLAEDAGSPQKTPAVGHVPLSKDRSKSKGLSVHSVDVDMQPECCRGNIVNGGPCNCVFQVLVECLFGMKVSIAERPEGKGIHAVHQSSGYAFTLTWVNNSASGKVEIMYHVISLGTYANVALEWMKEEVIIFSTTMCPIFFKKLSRFIGNK